MKDISRRKFVKMAGATLAGVSLAGISGIVGGCGTEAATKTAAAPGAKDAVSHEAKKATVYFTKHIDADHLLALYKKFRDDRKNDLIERIESREGLRQLSAMKELGMGTDQYELVSID